jgi:hypothetical protein
VAQAYRALPPEERARTAIYARNYGGAGAIDWFGPNLGLPPAFSGHQTYFYWGPPAFDGTTVIALETPRALLERVCTEVSEVARHENPYGEPNENGPIYLCRGLKPTLREL